MSDDGELRIEATGETVGEAKWSALRELERVDPALDKASVRFEVLAEGERGLLGVGYTPARVVARAARSASGGERPSDFSPAAAQVRELVTRIVEALADRPAVTMSEDEERIVASLTATDLGVLIGKHGQTIDAVQYLVNAIVRRSGETSKDVVIDAGGYRERRERTLESLAVRSAERARAAGAAVALEPMTAVERKVVHLALRDMPGVVTTSEGTEPNRHVVIAPSDNDR